jgi:hypothetical protein
VSDVTEVEASLRRWPAGPYSRAAVEELIAGGWLQDSVLVDTCVVPIASGEAVVDWAELAQYASALDGSDPQKAAGLREVYALASEGWQGPGLGETR